ncbi:hypothetical protein [Dongia deserti]|uniref:hypothetical protein n=1 Tax=Dongia deserti TaxID=2268030 RepID=UPI000E6505D8|nr:hypothetical protein [Dongia deserti]
MPVQPWQTAQVPWAILLPAEGSAAHAVLERALAETNPDELRAEGGVGVFPNDNYRAWSLEEML